MRQLTHINSSLCRNSCQSLITSSLSAYVISQAMCYISTRLRIRLKKLCIQQQHTPDLTKPSFESSMRMSHVSGFIEEV
jgi:hypothetical protein